MCSSQTYMNSTLHAERADCRGKVWQELQGPWDMAPSQGLAQSQWLSWGCHSGGEPRQSPPAHPASGHASTTPAGKIKSILDLTPVHI